MIVVVSPGFLMQMLRVQVIASITTTTISSIGGAEHYQQHASTQAIYNNINNNNNNNLLGPWQVGHIYKWRSSSFKLINVSHLV